MTDALVLHIANKNYSSWSLRPWVLLTQLGIAFEERMHPFGEVAFRTFSPTGLVPYLEQGEIGVWDSLAIAEYLAEQFEQVWPSDRGARAWARSASAEMHSGFPAIREQCSMTCGLRVALHRPDDPGLRSDLARLQELWTEGLERFGGPFLAGTSFTAVDAFYAPVAFRILTYGLDSQLSAASSSYAARLRALDAMEAWYAAALQETWRDLPHEEGMQRWGAVTADLRARRSADRNASG